jgi:UDP-N-acetylglucosamine 2-epimerase (non-hydrolysing)
MAQLLFEGPAALAHSKGMPFRITPELLRHFLLWQLNGKQTRAPRRAEPGKVLCVVGTRPEAVKMAPVILAIRKQPGLACRVLATAQHRQMLDQVLDFFSIKPDIDLDLMRPNQGLADLTARLMTSLDRVLQEEAPDVVLAQGDTTTVMTVAMACFYRGVPFGHIEAGLRTGDMQSPFPEEANRVIAGRLARWHFAPTQGARANLLKEGVAKEHIFVTGNTVIDALLTTAGRADALLPISIPAGQRMVLITAHRRENFGEPFRQVCQAVETLAREYPDTAFLYPVHPNPNVRDTAHRMLGALSNVHLCEPMDYAPFVAAMKRSYFIISDSGGVQEEAPALAKPVLLLRDETERPEAVEQGLVKLVGPHRDAIVTHARQLMDDEAVYRGMARGVSPYGDGRAAARIVSVVNRHMSTRTAATLASHIAPVSSVC